MSDPTQPPAPELARAPVRPPAAEPVRADAGRGAFMVAAGIFASRIFGLVRQRAFAHFFGDAAAADAYSAALRIPNVLRNLLGEGAISASFIPVYSGMLARGDEKQARALAGALLGLLLFGVSALTLIGIAIAPVLTTALVPGMDEGTRALTTRLVRILFPMAGIMVISGWCLGIQNSHRRFFMAYASAVLWSAAQIVLLVGWGPYADSLAQLAVWLAWATLAGSVLQVAAQVPEVIRLAAPMRVSLSTAVEGARETIGNFLPVSVALGVVSISGLVDQLIASFLPEGAIVTREYASMVYMLPVSLFGLSVAAASLPEFSRDSAVVAHETLLRRLRESWVRILFYIIPTVAVFIVLGDLVVGLIYRSGRFGADQQRIVHLVLAGYSLGLIGFTSVKLLASAYYAMQDYRTPLRAALFSLAVGSVAAAALALPIRHSLLGVVGIAVGSALGSYVNLTTLVRGLGRRLPGALFTGAMWRDVARISMATAAALGGALLVRFLQRDAHVALNAAGTLPVFGGIFLVSAHAAGLEEATRWLRGARIVRRK